MAIQASMNFNGIIISLAYIRIDRIFGGKREGWNSLVGIYANAAHAADGVTAPLEQFNHATDYDPLNLNAMELVYKSLSKLPRFAAGIAV